MKLYSLPATQLGSAPGVHRHTRNVWQSKVIRLEKARLDGVALAVVAKNDAAQGQTPVENVRVIVVHRDGVVIRSSVFRIGLAGSATVLVGPDVEFDVMRGPGADCRGDFPAEWSDQLVIGSIEAALGLLQRRWPYRERGDFVLPKAYVDADQVLTNRLEIRDCHSLSDSERQDLAARRIHVDGRKLLPASLLPTAERTGVSHVDLSTVDRIQPSGQATVEAIAKLTLAGVNANRQVEPTYGLLRRCAGKTSRGHRAGRPVHGMI